MKRARNFLFMPQRGVMLNNAKHHAMRSMASWI